MVKISKKITVAVLSLVLCLCLGLGLAYILSPTESLKARASSFSQIRYLETTERDLAYANIEGGYYSDGYYITGFSNEFKTRFLDEVDGYTRLKGNDSKEDGVDGIARIDGYRIRLVIPQTHNGDPVRFVSEGAFVNCIDIADISTPAGVYWQSVPIAQGGLFDVDNRRMFSAADGDTASIVKISETYKSGSYYNLIIPSPIWVDANADNKMDSGEGIFNYTEVIAQSEVNDQPVFSDSMAAKNLVITNNVVNIYGAANEGYSGPAEGSGDVINDGTHDGTKPDEVGGGTGGTFEETTIDFENRDNATFSSDTVLDSGDYGTITVLATSSDNSKTVSIESTSVTVDGVKYNKRLNFGGKCDSALTYRALKLDMNYPATVTIGAVGGAGRHIILYDGEKKSLNQQIEANGVSGSFNLPSAGTYFLGNDNAVRIAYIKITPAAAGASISTLSGSPIQTIATPRVAVAQPEVQRALSGAKHVESIHFATGRSRVLPLYFLTFESYESLEIVNLSAGVLLADGARVFQGSTNIKNIYIANEQNVSVPSFYVLGDGGALYSDAYNYEYYNHSGNDTGIRGYLKWFAQNRSYMPDNVIGGSAASAVAYSQKYSLPDNAPAYNAILTPEIMPLAAGDTYMATGDTGIGVPDGSIVFDFGALDFTEANYGTNINNFEVVPVAALGKNAATVYSDTNGKAALTNRTSSEAKAADPTAYVVNKFTYNDGVDINKKYITLSLKGTYTVTYYIYTTKTNSRNFTFGKVNESSLTKNALGTSDITVLQTESVDGNHKDFIYQYSYKYGEGDYTINADNDKCYLFAIVLTPDTPVVAGPSLKLSLAEAGKDTVYASAVDTADRQVKIKLTSANITDTENIKVEVVEAPDAFDDIPTIESGEITVKLKGTFNAEDSSWNILDGKTEFKIKATYESDGTSYSSNEITVNLARYMPVSGKLYKGEDEQTTDNIEITLTAEDMENLTAKAVKLEYRIDQTGDPNAQFTVNNKQADVVEVSPANGAATAGKFAFTITPKAVDGTKTATIELSAEGKLLLTLTVTVKAPKAPAEAAKEVTVNSEDITLSNGGSATVTVDVLSEGGEYRTPTLYYYTSAKGYITVEAQGEKSEIAGGYKYTYKITAAMSGAVNLTFWAFDKDGAAIEKTIKVTVLNEYLNGSSGIEKKTDELVRYQRLVFYPPMYTKEGEDAPEDYFEFTHNETTEIGGSAFAGTQLTVINIPDRITLIGQYAFRYSDKLQTVYLPANATLEQGIFGEEDDANSDIYTPAKNNFVLIASSRQNFEKILGTIEGTGRGGFFDRADENGKKDNAWVYSRYLTYEIDVTYRILDETTNNVSYSETVTKLYGKPAGFTKATAPTIWADETDNYDNNVTDLTYGEKGKLSNGLQWSIAENGWYIYDKDSNVNFSDTLPTIEDVSQWYYGGYEVTDFNSLLNGSWDNITTGSDCTFNNPTKYYGTGTTHTIKVMPYSIVLTNKTTDKQMVNTDVAVPGFQNIGSSSVGGDMPEITVTFDYTGYPVSRFLSNFDQYRISAKYSEYTPADGSRAVSDGLYNGVPYDVGTYKITLSLTPDETNTYTYNWSGSYNTGRLTYEQQNDSELTFDYRLIITPREVLVPNDTKVKYSGNDVSLFENSTYYAESKENDKYVPLGTDGTESTAGAPELSENGLPREVGSYNVHLQLRDPKYPDGNTPNLKWVGGSPEENGVIVKLEISDEVEITPPQFIEYNNGVTNRYKTTLSYSYDGKRVLAELFGNTFLSYAMKADVFYKVPGATEESLVNDVKEVGEYRVVIQPAAGYSWEATTFNGEEIADPQLEYKIEVSKILVPVPADQPIQTMHDGAKVVNPPYEFHTEETDPYKVAYYLKNGDEDTEANRLKEAPNDTGIYQVYLTLNDTVNYAWASGDTNGDGTVHVNMYVLTENVLPAPEFNPDLAATGELSNEGKTLEIVYARGRSVEWTSLFSNYFASYMEAKSDIPISANAGEYNITISLKDDLNYEFDDAANSTSLTFRLIIDKAQIGEPENLDKTGYLVGGKAEYVPDNTAYTVVSYEKDGWSGTIPDEAGTYTVTLKPVSSNYTWTYATHTKAVSGDDSVTAQFTVRKATVYAPTFVAGLADAQISDNTLKTTAENLTLADILNLNVNNRGITWFNNNAAYDDLGDITISIMKGADSFDQSATLAAGVYTITFTLPSDDVVWSANGAVQAGRDIVYTVMLGVKKVEAPSAAALTYKGSEYTAAQAIVIKDSTGAALDGSLFEATCLESILNATEYEVSVTLKGAAIWADGTTGAKTVTVTVNPATVNLTLNGSESYTGSEINVSEKVAVTAAWNDPSDKTGTPSVTASELTFAPATVTEAREYAFGSDIIVIAGATFNSNYTIGTVSGTFTVDRAELTLEINGEHVYTGVAQTASDVKEAVTVTVNGGSDSTIADKLVYSVGANVKNVKLVEGATSGYEFSNTASADVISVAIDDDNYEIISVSGSFKITPAQIKVTGSFTQTVSYSPTETKYDVEAKASGSLSNGLTLDALAASENIEVTFKLETDSNEVGDYSNSSGNLTVTYSVNVLNDEHNLALNNYVSNDDGTVVEYTRATFTIQVKSSTVTKISWAFDGSHEEIAADGKKVYDAQAHQVAATGYLADESQVEVEVSLAAESGSALTDGKIRNVGKYTATASAPAGAGYTIDSAVQTKLIEITPYIVNVSKYDIETEDRDNIYDVLFGYSVATVTRTRTPIVDSGEQLILKFELDAAKSATAAANKTGDYINAGAYEIPAEQINFQFESTDDYVKNYKAVAAEGATYTIRIAPLTVEATESAYNVPYIGYLGAEGTYNTEKLTTPGSVAVKISENQLNNVKDGRINNSVQLSAITLSDSAAGGADVAITDVKDGGYKVYIILSDSTNFGFATSSNLANNCEITVNVEKADLFTQLSKAQGVYNGANQNDGDLTVKFYLGNSSSGSDITKYFTKGDGEGFTYTLDFYTDSNRAPASKATEVKNVANYYSSTVLNPEIAGNFNLTVSGNVGRTYSISPSVITLSGIINFADGSDYVGDEVKFPGLKDYLQFNDVVKTIEITSSATENKLNGDKYIVKLSDIYPDITGFYGDVDETVFTINLQTTDDRAGEYTINLTAAVAKITEAAGTVSNNYSITFSGNPQAKIKISAYTATVKWFREVSGSADVVITNETTLEYSGTEYRVYATVNKWQNGVLSSEDTQTTGITEIKLVRDTEEYDASLLNVGEYKLKAVSGDSNYVLDETTANISVTVTPMAVTAGRLGSLLNFINVNANNAPLIDGEYEVSSESVSATNSFARYRAEIGAVIKLNESRVPALGSQPMLEIGSYSGNTGNNEGKYTLSVPLTLRKTTYTVGTDTQLEFENFKWADVSEYEVIHDSSYGESFSIDGDALTVTKVWYIVNIAVLSSDLVVQGNGWTFNGDVTINAYPKAESESAKMVIRFAKFPADVLNYAWDDRYELDKTNNGVAKTLTDVEIKAFIDKWLNKAAPEGYYIVLVHIDRDSSQNIPAFDQTYLFTVNPAKIAFKENALVTNDSGLKGAAFEVAYDGDPHFFGVSSDGKELVPVFDNLDTQGLTDLRTGTGWADSKFNEYYSSEAEIKFSGTLNGNYSSKTDFAKSTNEYLPLTANIVSKGATYANEPYKLYFNVSLKNYENLVTVDGTKLSQEQSCYTLKIIAQKLNIEITDSKVTSSGNVISWAYGLKSFSVKLTSDSKIMYDSVRGRYDKVSIAYRFVELNADGTIKGSASDYLAQSLTFKGKADGNYTGTINIPDTINKAGKYELRVYMDNYNLSGDHQQNLDNDNLNYVVHASDAAGNEIGIQTLSATVNKLAIGSNENGTEYYVALPEALALTYGDEGGYEYDDRYFGIFYSIDGSTTAPVDANTDPYKVYVYIINDNYDWGSNATQTLNIDGTEYVCYVVDLTINRLGLYLVLPSDRNTAVYSAITINPFTASNTGLYLKSSAGYEKYNGAGLTIKYNDLTSAPLNAGEYNVTLEISDNTNNLFIAGVLFGGSYTSSTNYTVDGSKDCRATGTFTVEALKIKVDELSSSHGASEHEYNPARDYMQDAFRTHYRFVKADGTGNPQYLTNGYVLSYTDGTGRKVESLVEVGNYTIWIQLKSEGNFDTNYIIVDAAGEEIEAQTYGVPVGTFGINKAKVEATVEGTLTYNGSADRQNDATSLVKVVRASTSSEISNVVLSGSVVGAMKNKGTYQVTFTLSANDAAHYYFEGAGGAQSGNITLSVEIVALNIRATLSDMSKVYSRSPMGATVRFATNGLFEGDLNAALNGLYTVLYDGSEDLPQNVKAGGYAVSVALKNTAEAENFNLTAGATGTFVITPARVSVTLNATDYSYTGSNLRGSLIGNLVFTNSANAGVLPQTGEYRITIRRNTSVADFIAPGVYNVAVDLEHSDNFEFATGVNGRFTVRIIAEISRVEWTAPQALVYTGSVQNVTVTALGYVNGLASPITLTVNCNETVKNAGNYVYTATADSPVYSFGAGVDNSYTLNVARAKIAISITEKSYYYNSRDNIQTLLSNIVLTNVSVSGGVVPGYTYTLTRDGNVESQFKKLGVYAIEIRLNDVDNFEISGSARITGIEIAGTYIISVTWMGESSYTYNGADRSASITVTGVDSDNNTVELTAKLLGNKPFVDAGEYVFVIDESVTGDYVFADGLITEKRIVIVPAQVSLEKARFEETFNGNAHTLSGLKVNLSDGSELSATEYEIIGNNNMINAGEYLFTVSLKTGNYKFGNADSAAVTFIVNKAQATISAEGKTVEYNGKPQGIDKDKIVIPEWADSRNVVVLYGDGYTLEPQNSGEFEVVVSLPETENYYGASATVTLTITKKAIKVNWNSASEYPANSADGTPYGGLANGDPETLVTVVYTTSDGAVTDGKPIYGGVYKVTVTPVDARNYVIDGEASKSFTITESAPDQPEVSEPQDAEENTGRIGDWSAVWYAVFALAAVAFVTSIPCTIYYLKKNR